MRARELVPTLVASLVLAACASGGDDGERASPPATTDERAPATTAAPRPRAPARPAEPARLLLEPVAAGLESPVHLAATPSEPERVYLVEQTGRIRVLENGNVRPEPFLDIRDLVVSGGEQGLLSVAFHPEYGENGRLYVDYTNRDGDTRVVEYRVNDERTAVDEATGRVLLALDQPYSNHNGGQLAFGPDGLLYVGMGDGGAGGDPEERAQNLSDPLGKVLRLDVETPGAEWEIVAYGLRNPWRFSFDRETGDLYLGDVGQEAWEEVDYVRWPLPRLVNFGWDAFEGRARYEEEEPNPSGRLVMPIVVYPRADGNCSVIGGFVYRGAAMPGLRGRYFYGDFCAGTVWSLRVEGGQQVRPRRERRLSVAGLSSFGEDARGELYLVSLEGRVYRVAGA